MEIVRTAASACAGGIVSCGEPQATSFDIEAEASVNQELRVLRATLLDAKERLRDDEEDFSKLGALIVRLCDSIARLQLAEQKLEAGADQLARIRSDLDVVLELIGLGAPEPAHAGKGGKSHDQRPN